MESENKNESRNKRRILFLIFLLAITFVITIVGTYAWFIGVSVVDADPFLIKVSSVETLDLSLDGETWASNTIIIDKDAVLRLNDSLDHKAYEGHKNRWININSSDSNGGLYPISFAGDVDEDSEDGRLKLFIKSSITASGGGYRFKAQQIDNSDEEQYGYVAFDLFIRDGMRDTYNATYNVNDNEAIYLTKDSKVVVTGADSGVVDYGIANSIRIAFMQVGRVNWKTTPVSKITGISCVSDAVNTGLCSDVKPVIWEPNNLKHNSMLIENYNAICRVRTGLNTFLNDEAYSCSPLVDGEDFNTYVVSRPISSAEKVDIYDGDNYYTGAGLKNVETFTDTQKLLSGEYRDPIFSLAPNSVTKVRVYIYLEGQDIDNNTLATLNGNTVSINFGFVKDTHSKEEPPEGEIPGLEDYSWEEIKRISEQLVSGIITYEDMVEKYSIEIGQTKNATINGELHEFRLIGVNHDIDAEGNTLGMTFEQVDLMDGEYSFPTSSGWGSSALKTTINNFVIDSDLDAVITPAKKSTITSFSNTALTYVTSKLWILSAAEMYPSNVLGNVKGGAIAGTRYQYYEGIAYPSNLFKKIRKGTYVGFFSRDWSTSASSSFILGESTSNNGVSVCFSI